MSITFTPAPPPPSSTAFGPIEFIPGQKGGRYPYCHSLVLAAGKETWVVDPSSDKAYLGRLAQTHRVTRVFLSHFHEDHQKYNYLFPEARFYVPVQELDAFSSLEAILTLAGIQEPRFQEHWRETLLREFHFQPLRQVTPFSPGQRFSLGEVVLEVVSAPGHTPGHSCFFFPRQHLIYLADVDLTSFGPWYGDAASDLEDFATTLRHLQQFRAQVYITAHEQGIFNYEEAQVGLAYFQQVIAHREARLLEVLTFPQSLPELVARRLIYGKPREPAFVYDHMEGQMLTKHLDRLLKRGDVWLGPEGYVKSHR